jgi:hypothetical protein
MDNTLPLWIMQKIITLGPLRKGDVQAIRCTAKTYSQKLVYVSDIRMKFGHCQVCGLRIRCRGKRTLNRFVPPIKIQTKKRDPEMYGIQLPCGCWIHSGCLIKRRSEHMTKCPYCITFWSVSREVFKKKYT